jgi:UDP-N-acetylglucosamine--N-acetylmuramyl-(pentapeptide) pyrophosphoryl-undecaprenol N-acetylglucosamine transferase
VPTLCRLQQKNAQYLVDRGAAVLLADADLPTRLLSTARDLMQDQPRRMQMRQALRSLARPQAAGEIAALLLRLASGNEMARNHQTAPPKRAV